MRGYHPFPRFLAIHAGNRDFPHKAASSGAIRQAWRGSLEMSCPPNIMDSIEGKFGHNPIAGYHPPRTVIRAEKPLPVPILPRLASGGIPCHGRVYRTVWQCGLGARAAFAQGRHRSRGSRAGDFYRNIKKAGFSGTTKSPSRNCEKIRTTQLHFSRHQLRSEPVI